jgi:hypothetical protein
MTNLLTQAFAEIAKLPAEEQDTIARWILEELVSEQRWADAFKRTSDQLARLGDEALAEYRAGQTPELDPDQL